MHPNRFDALTQALASPSIARRHALKALAASMLFGVFPPFGRKDAAAQTTCQPVGATCRRDGRCCSGICNRRRRRCVCKQLGKRCAQPSNCCADATGGQTCQGGKCCRQPGFGCDANAECCSGNCCDGFCCSSSQICEAGEGGALECTCDVVIGEEPCGLECCSLQQTCHNNACCTLDDKPCGGNAECCSGTCRDGSCRRPPECESDPDCPGYPGAKCCQGKCSLCPDNGVCIGDVCGCGGDGDWCPPGSVHPTGQCCGFVGENAVACCVGDQGTCGHHQACQPPLTTPAKPWPQT